MHPKTVKSGVASPESESLLPKTSRHTMVGVYFILLLRELKGDDPANYGDP